MRCGTVIDLSHKPVNLKPMNTDVQNVQLVFLDLDRTLIRKNSAFLWLFFARKHGLATWQQVFKGLFWLGHYALGLRDISDAYRDAIRDLRGQSEAVILAATEQFFWVHVQPLYRPGALDSIKVWQHADIPVVLLTSSSNYMASCVTRDLGLSDYLSSSYEVDAHGKYTGLVREPLAYGHGKCHLAENFLRARNIAWEHCAFYTDSHSDLPMLERVGHPMLVAPDPKLRRRAQQKNWPVVVW